MGGMVGRDARLGAAPRPLNSGLRDPLSIYTRHSDGNQQNPRSAAKLQPQEVLVQAAACVLARVGGDKRATDRGESQCQGDHHFFMSEVPRLLAWDLGASLSFRQKEAAAGVLQQVPAMYMSRTHLPGERR